MAEDKPTARGQEGTREQRDRRPRDDRGRGTPLSQQIGRITIVALLILFLIFAFANLQPVDFDWIFGETQVVRQGGEVLRGGVPLIVLLLSSFALGAIVGAGLVWRRHRRTHRARDRATAASRQPPPASSG